MHFSGNTIFSTLSGLLFIVGFIPYIHKILRKKTKPVKVTWIIWATLDTIILFGMIFERVINGLIIGAVISGWTVAILSLKYGLRGWNALDKFYLVGAILGIILWQIFNSPVLGIIISLCVMFIGSIPTFVSAWKTPDHEDKLTWTIFWFSSALAVVAISQWTLADITQPITFLLIDTIMLYILYIHSQKYVTAKKLI